MTQENFKSEVTHLASDSPTGAAGNRYTVEAEMTEQDWDTGPYCRHYVDPAACDIHCASCGHHCIKHDFGEGECFEPGCDCEQWKEA